MQLRQTSWDFGTGDFSGWTTTLDPAWDGVDTLAPQAGIYGAYCGSPGASTISQTRTDALDIPYTQYAFSEPDSLLLLTSGYALAEAIVRRRPARLK